MVERLAPLPAAPSHSFFLWGPRQTGKSTLLHTLYPDAYWLDLLKTDEFVRYSTAPSLLRQELETRPPGELVVVDEIQKVPGLLDEIHWLIENRGRVFAMSGRHPRAPVEGVPGPALGRRPPLTGSAPP